LKKYWISIVVAAGLFLLASCGSKEGIGPITIVDKGTPTPIVVPTCTPTVTPTPNPEDKPVIPSPTPTVTVAPSPTPTETPEITPTVAPTVTPTPVPDITSVPEETPTVTPTVAPTEAPEPFPLETVTPTPEVTEIPEEQETPEIDPKPLVYKGWQQTVSIDRNYLIIFPDMFKDSVIDRTEQELKVLYSCAADEAISFQTSYVMQTSLEELLSSIPETEEIVVEHAPEEQRVSFVWNKDGMIYQGIIQESRYPGEWLETSVEDEWISGVMQVVFGYPEERKNEYETVWYRFFVVNNGGE